MSENMDALRSVGEASQRLKLDEPVVSALAQVGLLPAVRVGQRWKIPPEGLTEFRLRICRGEVPRDITPVNGVIAGAPQRPRKRA